MIRFERVTRIYAGSDRGVTDLDFRLGAGLTGFLGRNGSGKTTTMRLLVGLLMPDRGRVLIDGKDLWQYPHVLELKRCLALPGGGLPAGRYAATVPGYGTG